MSERYTKVFALPENLYAEGSPVVVSAGHLLMDNQTGKVLAQLKIKNISSKAIRAATVLIHGQDTAGKAIDGDAQQKYLDLTAKTGEEFGQKTAVPLPDASTRAFSLEVTRVVFEDRSTWEGTQAPWEPLPEAVSLSKELGDAELVKQYKLKAGPKCAVYPKAHKDLWLCACGTWNRGEKCCACGKTKSELLTIDIEALTAEKDARLAREKAEREAKEAENKAAAEARAKKTKRMLMIAIPVIALCIVALLIVTKVIIPNSNYSKAKALMDAGRYEEAIAAFEALNGYKDSAAQITAAKVAKIEAEKAAVYEGTEKLASEGKTFEAATAFYQMKDYKDSWQRCFDLWGTLTCRETISAGDQRTVGVKADGTVVAAGYSSYDQSDVIRWTDIVAVSVGGAHTVGLKADGTAVAAGSSSDGQCDVSGWKDIVAIAAGSGHTVGLKADGTVVATGSNSNGQCEISDWTDIVAIAVGDFHTVGLKADGTMVAAGYNGRGQCDISDWADIVAIAAGSRHTVGLKADGTVIAAGTNVYGQCNTRGWRDIVTITAGYNHTVGLRVDGTVVAVGLNDDGQRKVSGWRDIVAIAAGYNHTVGLKEDGTVVALGSNKVGQCDVSGWTNIKLPD